MWVCLTKHSTAHSLYQSTMAYGSQHTIILLLQKRHFLEKLWRSESHKNNLQWQGGKLKGIKMTKFAEEKCEYQIAGSFITSKCIKLWWSWVLKTFQETGTNPPLDWGSHCLVESKLSQLSFTSLVEYAYNKASTVISGHSKINNFLTVLTKKWNINFGLFPKIIRKLHVLKI